MLDAAGGLQMAAPAQSLHPVTAKWMRSRLCSRHEIEIGELFLTVSKLGVDNQKGRERTCGGAAKTQMGMVDWQCLVWAVLPERASWPRKASCWDKMADKVQIIDGYINDATISSNHEITLTFQLPFYHSWLRAWSQESSHLNQIPAPPFASCMTLGKQLNPSVPCVYL